MSIQSIVSPSGDELVVLSRQEYQDLLDARDHAAAMHEVASGVQSWANISPRRRHSRTGASGEA